MRVSQTGRARQAGLWAARRGGGRAVGGRRAPRGAATAPEAEAEQCAAAPAGRTVARGAACAPLMSVESPMISGGSALAAMRSLAFRGGLPAGIVRGGPARRSPKPARSARAVRAGAGPCALTTLCGRAARRLERYLEYLKQPAGLGAVSPCHSGLALRSPPRPSPPSAPGTQPPTRQKSRAVAFGCAPTRRSLLRGLPCSSPLRGVPRQNTGSSSRPSESRTYCPSRRQGQTHQPTLLLLPDVVCEKLGVPAEGGARAPHYRCFQWGGPPLATTTWQWQRTSWADQHGSGSACTAPAAAGPSRRRCKFLPDHVGVH